MGKQQNGNLIAAGHAILSAHEDSNGASRSEHGYYVAKCNQTFQNPYEFCTPADIPGFLRAEADSIDGSGSIVAILGFKGFPATNETEDDSPCGLSQAILEAVAENFAVAIFRKMLAVEVHTEEGETDTINQSSVSGFLDWMSRSDTGTKESTRNAQHTLQAIHALQQPDIDDTLQDEFNDCQILLRNRAPSHSVSIWRNGMLITRKYQGLAKNHFEGKKPLNAVVLLSGTKNPRIAHDIVKKAETPLHDRIQSTRLTSKGEKERLRSLMGNIRHWIKQNAIESGGQSLYLDDEIVLDTGHVPVPNPVSPIRSVKDDDEGDDASTPELGGLSTETASPTPLPPNNTEMQGRRGKRAVTRANQTTIRAQGRQTSDGYLVNLKPLESAERAVLEILIDTGQDPSCSGGIPNRDTTITSATVLPSNESTNSSAKVNNDLVELRNLEKDKPVRVRLTFDPPLPEGVSLKCQVGRQ